MFRYWSASTLYRHGVTTMIRRGVTLVEVLVAIFIIAILIAIVIPAAQSARESSRRLQCQNNIRQTLVATHSHHEAKHAVPSLYGGSSPPYPLPASEQSYRHSWRVPLLPYIEQSQLWDLVRWDLCATATENTAVAQTLVSEFVCPSGGDPSIKVISWRRNAEDPTAEPFDTVRSDYEAAGGILIDPQGLYGSTSVNTGAFVRYGVWGRPVFEEPTSPLGSLVRYQPGRFSDVTNGLSRTVAIVERAGKPNRWLNGKMSGVPYPGQLGWSISNIVLRSLNLYRVGVNESNWEGMYSFHPGGANVGMADGSVQLLADTTSFDSLVQLYGGSIEGF